MTGSPEVIDALLIVYNTVLPTKEQAHRQEHALEADGYDAIGAWFDKIEGEKKGQGHAVMIHPLMNRIKALRGEFGGTWAFMADTARPVEQLDQAVASMVGRLRMIHAALLNAYEAGERAKDYVTCQCFIVPMMEWLEKQVGRFEDRQAQIEAMGLDNFLSEMFDKG